MPGSSVYHKYDASVRVPDKLVVCLCPRCTNSNFVERVMAVMQNMPPDGYRDLRRCMLVPFLKSFSELNPAMFPCVWVDISPAEKMPTNPMRCIFHHMCSCLYMHKDIEGDEAEDVVRSIHSWGEELVSWLMRRRRRAGEAGTIEHTRLIRIAASLQELIGVDMVYRRVYLKVSSILRRAHTAAVPLTLCAYAFEIGRPLHMLAVAQLFYSWYENRGSPSRECSQRVVVFLGSLIWLLRSKLMQQTERHLAVAMALHARLGLDAGVAGLGADILPACLPKRSSSIVTWREAMGRWIGEDSDIVCASS